MSENAHFALEYIRWCSQGLGRACVCVQMNKVLFSRQNNERANLANYPADANLYLKNGEKVGFFYTKYGTFSAPPPPPPPPPPTNNWHPTTSVAGKTPHSTAAADDDDDDNDVELRSVR